MAMLLSDVSGKHRRTGPSGEGRIGNNLCPPQRVAGGAERRDNGGTVTDFRDHRIQKALDEAVGPWRPEADARSRRKRIAVVVALALAAWAVFWTVLYFSSPKHAAPAPRMVPIQVLPAPAK
jgi:hypothetical protein